MRHHMQDENGCKSDRALRSSAFIAPSGLARLHSMLRTRS